MHDPFSAMLDLTAPSCPGTVLFLYDLTGNMGKPWLDAGYEVHIVDIQHPPGRTVRKDGVICWGVDLVGGWLPPREITDRLRFAGAWPPCDHLAVSGSRWFKGKGLRKLSQAILLFGIAAELLEWLAVPYFIENPVSTISSYWRKPDHIFSPDQYTRLEPSDNYTKKTCLWTGGGFVMPPAEKDVSLGVPDDRIHKAPPGPERANFRSATPMGFSRAVFAANRPVLG